MAVEAPWQHGPLRASDNGRYIQHEDGTPFFWLGDTAWELFHRLDREEADHFLKTRAEQGINVIQAVALAEIDGLNDPNRYGHRPLLDNDPTRPDPSGYWDHMDYVIDRAAEYGLYIGLLPTWGDKVHPAWGVGPCVFNKENAYTFGRWIADRYKNRPNIIWINGGDRDPRGFEEIWRAVARGLRGGDGHRRLMSFHPPGERSSSEDLHDEEWLDLNMLQTGHGKRELDRIVRMIQAGYHRTPTKPILDGEPRYENHPIQFNPSEGYFDAGDVRLAVYTSVFAGGCGVTYGCHAVWQMAQDRYHPINNPISHWRYSLDLTGANQMRHLKTLAYAIRFHEMAPDQSLVSDNSSYRALRSLDGSRAAVYAANGGGTGVSRSFRGGRYAWFDPRKGTTTDWVALDGQDHAEAPHAEGRVKDWVLLLER
jgi:hypothetical protein